MAPSDDNLLLFTPVPTRPGHTAGWTSDRQIAFIAALARTGVVRAAAASVGMSARSAYQLRARARHRARGIVDVAADPAVLDAVFGPGATYSFAAAWDRALSHALGLLLEAAIPVALEPDRVPIVRRGRVVAWHDKPNERLMLAALGAWRRYHEGPAYDHELRIAERTQDLAEAIETLLRLGPPRWPDPPPPEEPEARRERLRREHALDLRYGPDHSGLRDPFGPAGLPPRPLAIQERAARAAWARVRERKLRERATECPDSRENCEAGRAPLPRVRLCADARPLRRCHPP